MRNTVPANFEQLGFTLGIQVCFWLTILCVVATAIAFVVSVRTYDPGDFWFGIGCIAAVCAVIMALITAMFLWPFGSRFWYNYEATGHVTNVSNVITEASGDLTRQPVVTLDTLDRPVVIDDPRAVSLEGKDVTLRCQIEWHYQAADSYSCKIVDFTSSQR